MLNYFYKKLISGLLTLLLLLTTCFFLFEMFPKNRTDEDGKKINIVSSDGIFSEYSLIENVQIFKQRAVSTWPLAMLSFCVIIFGAFLLSFLSQKNYFLYSVVSTIKFLFLSMPVIILGPLLIWIFCIHFNWLDLQINFNSPASIILPVFLLSYKSIGVCTEILINSYNSYFKTDHYRTLKSFGISENIILSKWALKFVLPSIFSYLPFLIAGLFTGSIFIEYIFSNSGLGSLFLESISKREIGMLLVLCAFYFILYAATQVLSDLLLFMINPQVEIEN